MFEATTLINLVVYIIVIGAVFGLLWWLINYVSMPEPFAKVARVILAIVGVLILIGILMSFVGHPILK